MVAQGKACFNLIVCHNTVQYCNKRDMKIVEHISTLSPLYLPGGDRPSLLAGDQLEIVQSYPDTYIWYYILRLSARSRTYVAWDPMGMYSL